METAVSSADGRLDRVVQALADKQGEANNAQFAKKLGISSVMWGYLKAGERKPGMKFYSSVMKVFPELQLLVFQAMNEKGTSK